MRFSTITTFGSVFFSFRPMDDLLHCFSWQKLHKNRSCAACSSYTHWSCFFRSWMCVIGERPWGDVGGGGGGEGGEPMFLWGTESGGILRFCPSLRLVNRKCRALSELVWPSGKALCSKSLQSTDLGIQKKSCVCVWLLVRSSEVGAPFHYALMPLKNRH